MSYASVKTADKAEIQSKLLEAHNALGRRKQEVRAILSDMSKTEFALTIKFGRAVVQVSAGGDAYGVQGEGDAVEDIDPSANGAVVKGITLNAALKSDVPGSVPGNKEIDGLIIPCGVCLIVGPGGVGKSPLAQALASHGVEDYAMVRIGEPLSGYSASEKEAAQSIAQAMLEHSDVVIDSVKDLLSSGGAAMKAGISRESLVTLSAWSSLACDLGCTLYVPVNPSSADEMVLELLAEAARSNATSTLIYSGSESWSFFGRTGEGLPRVSENVTFSSQGSPNVGDTATYADGLSVRTKRSRNARQVSATIDLGESQTYQQAIARALITESTKA